MIEACASESEPKRHRELIGRAAAQLCFAIREEDTLAALLAIFAVLGARDEKLLPALARARAIATTRRRAA
jgi:hypothetical protein